MEPSAPPATPVRITTMTVPPTPNVPSRASDARPSISPSAAAPIIQDTAPAVTPKFSDDEYTKAQIRSRVIGMKKTAGMSRFVGKSTTKLDAQPVLAAPADHLAAILQSSLVSLKEPESSRFVAVRPPAPLVSKQSPPTSPTTAVANTVRLPNSPSAKRFAERVSANFKGQEIVEAPRSLRRVSALPKADNSMTNLSQEEIQTVGPVDREQPQTLYSLQSDSDDEPYIPVETSPPPVFPPMQQLDYVTQVDSVYTHDIPGSPKPIFTNESDFPVRSGTIRTRPASRQVPSPASMESAVRTPRSALQIQQSPVPPPPPVFVPSPSMTRSLSSPSKPAAVQEDTVRDVRVARQLQQQQQQETELRQQQQQERGIKEAKQASTRAAEVVAKTSSAHGTPIVSPTAAVNYNDFASRTPLRSTPSTGLHDTESALQPSLVYAMTLQGQVRSSPVMH
eukprot:TRINITY_DN9473_c0_g1_i1.p1 TRINITY_DN9473_c0_g1~~TRINITY_DN9473_c0_g1_i1.p1  ORF type:complete len:458 (+),score=94.23 TRINITY_DN9473_c0_g1_i1:23-1375(+)